MTTAELEAWLDILKPAGTVVGTGIVGALGYWVAAYRARKNVATALADTSEEDERGSEAKARKSLLALATQREADRTEQWLVLTDALADLRGKYAADQVRLQNLMDDLKTEKDSVARLRKMNYAYATRLRAAGGALNATDILDGDKPPGSP